MTKRFAMHSGSMGDVGTAHSLGCTEFGYVLDWKNEGQNGTNACASYATQIHNAGIPTATLNIFNDGQQPPCQIGAAGGQWAGYFSAIASAGWNCISGEGCGGSVVGTVQNYLPYINYGGDQQNEMYASPWDHPSGGGKGHWDYIETYTAGNPSEVENVGGVEGCINSAKSNGAGHLGILIGAWASADAGTYQGMIDSCGCDTVCVWAGYNSSAATGAGFSAFQQLISAYGAAKDGSGGAASGGGGSAAAQTVTKTLHCPCRHISIGFQGVNGNSTSEHLEFKVKLVGTAGWVDDNEKWIHGKYYTGLLALWCRDSDSTSATVTKVTNLKYAPCQQGDPWASGGPGTWTNPDDNGNYQTFTPNAICPVGSTSTVVTTTTATPIKGKSWKVTDFWPEKDGTFALWIGSDTTETRTYSVCFASPTPANEAYGPNWVTTYSGKRK